MIFGVRDAPLIEAANIGAVTVTYTPAQNTVTEMYYCASLYITSHHKYRHCHGTTTIIILLLKVQTTLMMI